MKPHALSLMIAALLASAGAQAATPAAAPAAAVAAAPAARPAADPEAARAEIDRLIARIRELSQQLGDDARVRVEMRHRDGMAPPPEMLRDQIVERRRMAGHDGDERMLRHHGAGIGIVMAPNPAANGVRIAAITPDSPAAKSGLRSGDVLISIDGKRIAGSGVEAMGSARDLLGDLKKGQQVKLGYAREGKSGTVSVQADDIHRMMMFDRGGMDLADRGDMAPMPGEHEHGERHYRVFAPEISEEIERIGPDGDCPPDGRHCRFPAMFEAFRWQGLNLASLDDSLGRYFGTSHGVLVLSSGDELQGLQSGDVIVRVAGTTVDTPRAVMRALRDKDSGSQLKLDLLRDRKATAVTITVPEARPLPFMAPPAPPVPPTPPVPPVPPQPPEAAPAPPAPPQPPMALL